MFQQFLLPEPNIAKLINQTAPEAPDWKLENIQGDDIPWKPFKQKTIFCLKMKLH